MELTSGVMVSPVGIIYAIFIVGFIIAFIVLLTRSSRRTGNDSFRRDRLKRSSRDKSLHGVCGGIAEFIGISSFVVRVIFIITMPTSLLIYIILANTLDENIQL